jgi:hypothetical protein
LDRPGVALYRISPQRRKKLDITMLSIIIPTKNERRYLPRLLIHPAADFSRYEIIVADNQSQDRTAELAPRRVRGWCSADCRRRGGIAGRGERGRPAPFLGRGRRAADADFLARALAEFERRRLAMGVPLAFTEGNFLTGSSSLVELLRRLYAVCGSAGGRLVHLRAPGHPRALGGFDEQIRLGEDSDYARGGSAGQIRLMPKPG